MVLESTENDDGLAEAVKSMEALVDEAIQVYELDKEKTNVIDDLYNSLKVITNFLGFSVDLHPELLNLPQETRAILTPSLDILIIRPNFKAEQKRFDQLSLKETANVLRFAVPTLISMARVDRMSISQKIAFLRGATKKLKRIQKNTDDNIITDTTALHTEKVES